MTWTSNGPCIFADGQLIATASTPEIAEQIVTEHAAADVPERVRQQIEADVRAKLADEIERMRADFAQETRLASAAFTAAQHRGLKAPRGMVGEMLAGWDDAMRTVERCMRLACDPGRDFIETDVSRDITSEKSLGYVSTLGRVAQEIARGAQDGAAE